MDVSASRRLEGDLIRRYGRKAYEAIEHDKQREGALPFPTAVYDIAAQYAIRAHRRWPPQARFHGEMEKGPWIE